MNVFTVKLGETYLNQGFFNVGVRYGKYFSENHGDEIVIELDNPNHVIKGYINRTANTNATPRVMCGSEFTKWINRHFKLGDYLKVGIISSLQIRVFK